MIQAVTNWNELVLVRKLESNVTTYMYTVRSQRWTQARTHNWVKQVDKFYTFKDILEKYTHLSIYVYPGLIGCAIHWATVAKNVS